MITGSTMKITESFLRRIIREELSRSFLNEADNERIAIRRRPGGDGGESAEMRVNRDAKPSRPTISSISNVKTTPDRAFQIPVGSPWVGSKELHDQYNMGTGEETVRFKIKNKASGEEGMMSSLKNNKLEGSDSNKKYVVIPELFSLSSSPIAKHEAFGVAEVASEIITLPNRHSKGGVPVVTLYFPDSQKPEGALNKQTGISIAFLQIIGWREAEEARRMFVMQKNDSSSDKRSSRPVDPSIERAREKNDAGDRAREELGIRRR